MPASPLSRPPHAPANTPAHDPWKSTVEHDVPLLHPKALSDAGDDDEEASTTKGDTEQPIMPVSTDQHQPPPTPPKNTVSPPPKSDHVGADARGSSPPRAYTQSRGSLSSTIPPPISPSKYQGTIALPNRDRQTGTGAIGSPSGGYVAALVSQQSSSPSFSTPSTSTATATQGGAAAQRNPRSSSFFRSSPLAASTTSSSSGMVAKNSHYFPPSASTSTTGLISTFSSSSGSPLPPSTTSPATLTSSSTLISTSPSISTPNSMAPSSSSSFIHQGQGQGARTGQRQRTLSEANSALSGSSASMAQPMPPNALYASSHAYSHPNPTNPPPQQQQQHQQPFARQGSRNGAPPNAYPHNASGYGHAPRGPSEESRSGFEGGQSTPHTYASSHTGFMGGAGITYGSSINGNGASGPGVGLRDPGIAHSHSRGSMILYRLSATEDGILPPPGMPVGRRASMYSNSGDSIASLGGDSKYPLVAHAPYAHGGSGTRTPGTPGRPGTPGTPASGSIGNRGGEHSLAEIGRVQGGLVAYVYDPGEDLDADELDEEEEEWVRNVGGHVGFGGAGGRGDVKSLGSMGKGSLVKGKSQRSTLSKIPPMPLPLPNGKGGGGGGKMHSRVPMTTPTPPTKSTGVSVRGLVNVGTLVILLIGLLLLFLLYPIYSAYNNNGVEQLIIGNTRINSTGQAALELIAVAEAAEGKQGVDGGNGKREWVWRGFEEDLP